ncbi:MAG: hypothetical protein Q8L89_08785 [Gammaproteobacteria bacterium]|nr:hypothetical protein [Gammaproteobacteria bacterium]
MHTREPSVRYSVDAWLENGAPRLRLVDERGAVRLDWVCRKDAGRDCAARTELQRLFKDLFLLAGTARMCGIGTVGQALADACLTCGECAPEPTRGAGAQSR